MNSISLIEQIWQEKDQKTRERLGCEYRRMLLSALVVAEHYRQEGRELRDIIHHLDRLEKWMVTTFAPSAAPDIKKLADDEERRIGQLMLGESGKTINDVLSIAETSHAQALQTLVNQSSRPSLTVLPHGVQARHVDGVMLPPARERHMPNGDAPWIESKNVIPRLEMLLDVLKDEGVDMSTIEVIEGEAPEKSFRHMPYWCIPVPSVNKQVLICEQEKQGTYIIHGMLPLHELFVLSKDELLEKDTPKIEMISYWSQRSWKAKMSQVLFDDEKKKKMRAEIAGEIKQIYTVEKWIDMTNFQKRDLKIGEKKYSKIASDLGVPLVDKSMTQESHLELAAVIYGDENPVLAPYLKKMRARVEKERELGEDPEKWRPVIRAEYSYERWMALTAEERLKFDFFGKSLYLLAIIFGAKDKRGVVIVRTEILKLTLAVFNDIPQEEREKLEMEIQKIGKAEELKGSPEKLKEQIKETYTSADWVGMTYEVYSKINIGGLGIDSIASVFGVPGVFQGSRILFIQLGAAVYGKDDEHIKKHMDELEILEDSEKLKETLRKKYTAEHWANMEVPEKKEFQLYGIGLLGIGTLVGYKGKPVSYHIDHLKIGALIFEKEEVEKYIRPDLDNAVKAEELGDDQDKWRDEITKRYTREQWANMGGPERRQVSIYGKRMTSIATIFGAERNILSNNEAYQKLTDAIFSSDKDDTP